MGKRRDVLWLVALLAAAALLFRPSPTPREAPTPVPAVAATAVLETPSAPVVTRSTPVDLTGLWTLDQFLEAARAQDPEVASRAREVWKGLSDQPEPAALESPPEFRRGDVDESYGSGFLVVDGNVQVSHLRDAVLIATGRVTVSHSANSLILCGGRLDIGHDGSENNPSILVTGDFAEVSHATGSVMAARRGLDLSWAHAPVRVINTRTTEAVQNVLHLESPKWPYASQLPPPEYRKGGSLDTLPRNLPVHVVAVYESGLPDHSVTVTVPDGPVVLVLSSYEEVVWKVKGDVRGVLLGGYHPSTVEGLGKDVPLACKWGDDLYLLGGSGTDLNLAPVKAMLGVEPAGSVSEYAGKSFQVTSRP